MLKCTAIDIRQITFFYIYRKVLMDAKAFSEHALPLEQLEVGMQVTVLHTIITVTDGWIKAHTGTILAINTLDRFITFDFPNKQFDKNPTIPIHRFIFSKIEDDGDNRMYLVREAAMKLKQDTAASQQSLRNQFTMSQ